MRFEEQMLVAVFSGTYIFLLGYFIGYITGGKKVERSLTVIARKEIERLKEEMKAK